MVSGRRYSIAVVGKLLWARRWLVVIPLVLVTAGAFTLAYRLPNRYRSETTILVVPQRVPESYVRSTVTSRIEDRLRTITQQILSRTRLERIINEFKLYPEASKTRLMEETVEQMRAEVGIELVKGDSFKLSFAYSDPEVAAKVTERLASLFIDENLRDRELQADGTSNFLEAQLNDARRRLMEQEKRLEDYRKRHSGTLPSQMPSNLQVIQSTQQQIQALTDATNRYRDRRVAVQRLIAENESTLASLALAPPPAPPTAEGPSPATVAGTAEQQLEVARRNLQTLLLRLKPEHPDVLRARRQIGELEATVSAQPKPAPDAPRPIVTTNPALVQAQNRISDLKAELTNLDGQIAHNENEGLRLQGVVSAYQARLETLPTRESELTELTRDYATLQESYRALLAKREDSVIAANLERRQIGEQFRVVDPARVPERPYSPNRLLINIIGVVLGLGIGLGAVLLLEVLDTTLRSDEEVAGELGLAALALIPEVVTTADLRLRRRNQLLGAVAVVTITLGGLGFTAWKLGMLGR